MFSTQELLPVLLMGPYVMPEARTQVDRMQDKYSTCCTIAPVLGEILYDFCGVYSSDLYIGVGHL